MPSLPTTETRGASPAGKALVTTSVAMRWSVVVTPATRSSDPPRNSMPGLMPFSVSTSTEPMTSRMPIANQYRALPTKSKDRLPE